jgi:hypothetical protein
MPPLLTEYVTLNEINTALRKLRKLKHDLRRQREDLRSSVSAEDQGKSLQLFQNVRAIMRLENTLRTDSFPQRDSNLPDAALGILQPLFEAKPEAPASSDDA